MQGIDRRRFEIEMQVEAPGVFIDGVHEQGANADGVGGLRRSHQGIEQQSSSKTFALLPAIYGKPSQESSTNRVIGETFGDSRRGIVAADAAGGQRVITDNDIIPRVCDINLGGVSLLVLPGEAL